MFDSMLKKSLEAVNVYGYSHVREWPETRLNDAHARALRAY